MGFDLLKRIWFPGFGVHQGGLELALQRGIVIAGQKDILFVIPTGGSANCEQP